MNRQKPGFLLIELLSACALASLGILLLIRWHGVIIEHKAAALHNLNLVWLVDSMLDRITIDDSVKSKGSYATQTIEMTWVIKTLPLNNLDHILSKAATPHYFNFIGLDATHKQSPSASFKAYRGFIS